jgi:ankyrin repeat protein
MTTIDPADPLAVAVVEAIQTGDQERLARLLATHPGLATARLGDDRPGGMTRTLLHAATDWPGHFPNGPATVALLVEAGAEVNARFGGANHDETPLHWAASSDDVEVLDALVDLGADIEAPGAVIAGGTPLTDARAFGQWRPPTGWSSAGPGQPSTTRPPSASRTGWRATSPGPLRPPTMSAAPSGAPATAASAAAPSTYWNGAPTPTGSRPGSR